MKRRGRKAILFDASCQLTEGLAPKGTLCSGGVGGQKWCTKSRTCRPSETNEFSKYSAQLADNNQRTSRYDRYT